MSLQAFAIGAGANIFRTIERVPAIDCTSAGERPAGCLGHILLDAVGFSYPSRRDVPVLSKFSLNIPAGKTTALVGA